MINDDQLWMFNSPQPTIGLGGIEVSHDLGSTGNAAGKGGGRRAAWKQNSVLTRRVFKRRCDDSLESAHLFIIDNDQC